MEEGILVENNWRRNIDAGIKNRNDIHIENEYVFLKQRILREIKIGMRNKLKSKAHPNQGFNDIIAIMAPIHKLILEQKFLLFKR